MSKSSYTPEFRAKIAQEYLNGNCSRGNQGDRNGGHLIGYGGLISVPVAQ